MSGGDPCVEQTSGAGTTGLLRIAPVFAGLPEGARASSRRTTRGPPEGLNHLSLRIWRLQKNRSIHLKKNPGRDPADCIPMANPAEAPKPRPVSFLFDKDTPQTEQDTHKACLSTVIRQLDGKRVSPTDEQLFLHSCMQTVGSVSYAVLVALSFDSSNIDPSYLRQ